MLNTFEEILRAALELAPEKRAILADHLLTSLDGPNQKEIDASWAEEAERRMREIDEGKLETIDGELVMQKLRSRRLEQAAEIRHKLEGRHQSDSTQEMIEDRRR